MSCRSTTLKAWTSSHLVTRTMAFTSSHVWAALFECGSVAFIMSSIHCQALAAGIMNPVDSMQWLASVLGFTRRLAISSSITSRRWANFCCGKAWCVHPLSIASKIVISCLGIVQWSGSWKNMVINIFTRVWHTYRCINSVEMDYHERIKCTTCVHQRMAMHFGSQQVMIVTHALNVALIPEIPTQNKSNFTPRHFENNSRQSYT